MAFVWSLLNDAMCQEDWNKQPKKDYQQYNPDLGNASRPNYPYASRAANGSPKPVVNGSQLAMSEQEGGWSRTPPQARNAAASQPSQTRTRGAGGPAGDNAGGWSSKPPQSGRPQQQPPPNQGRQSQDGSSPRGQGNQQASNQQASNQQGASRQTPPLGSQKEQARQQQMRNRQNRNKQVEEQRDTVIGKGFTAAMKRGVAQAKPTPMHEEMVPQKDGGFIATIQKGFEGLFGKPTSKEEVLRKRGAVLANEYEAVPGDEIDQRVQFFARRLPEDVSGCFKIFRAAKGEYEINGEKVNMEMRYRQNPQGQTDKEIFVFWTTEAGEQSDPEPLGEFLSHAANVAYEVKQGGNIITQVPENVRMSFHEEVGTKLTDGSADARFNAMEVAARQAKMREEAAMEWREKQNKPKEEDSEEEAPKAKAEAPTPVQERPVSAEGGFLEAALQAVGVGARPSPTHPPQMQHAAWAAPAAAVPAPSRQMPKQGFGAPGAPNGLSMAPLGAAQHGTFYGAQHSTFASQVPTRQGTMYAYGSASPPSVMASAAGFPAMAPIQRQGTMYAYGSAYPVPVR